MIAAVVLAAGEASRFGSPKQALLLPAVVERVRRAAVDEVVVVLGAHPVPVEGAQAVIAGDWARGPGASLRAGLSGLGPEVEAAVVVLADGPFLTRADFPQIAVLAESGHRSFAPAALPPAVPMMAGEPFLFDPAASSTGEGDETPEDMIAAVNASGDVRPLADIEAEMIRLALEKYHGRMSLVARRLGIGRSTLYRKLKDLGLDADVIAAE